MCGHRGEELADHVAYRAARFEELKRDLRDARAAIAPLLRPLQAQISKVKKGEQDLCGVSMDLAEAVALVRVMALVLAGGGS